MTHRVFVIGHPIAHSRSPMMQNYWIARHGVDAVYDKLDIAPADLADFFRAFRAEPYIGANVTIPHKLAVIPFVDRTDGAAQAMGAVNCLWWDGAALVGGNTDALGFLGNIDAAAPGWDAGGKHAVVMGAGGASRAAIYGLLSRGFAVSLCNRTLDKAVALARHFGAGVTAHGLDAVPDLLVTADVVVNTTSLGMIGQPPLDLDLAPMKPDAVAYDIVYVPLETAFLARARARGLRTVDGLGMLLHQGVVGFDHWFGQRPDVTPDLRALLENDIRAKTPGA
ncbi:MAG: shikimate dehydrogenase [Rhodobacteraceae bacterium]|nr:shikimate dehydrogenase [Paracoccaceae bacterium]